MAAKPCIGCRSDPPEPKKEGHPKWCIECWYLRQPSDVIIRYAHMRLEAVPSELRKPRVPKEHWPEGRRWCSGCQSFVRIVDLRAGASMCRACQGERSRDTYLRGNYDINRAEEEAIWIAQGRKCPICLRKVHTKRPAVDHDHNTLEVRGLLDPGEHGCNNAFLGALEGACKSDTKQMIAMLHRAIDYLENPPARAVLERMRGG